MNINTMTVYYTKNEDKNNHIKSYCNLLILITNGLFLVKVVAGIKSQFY